jgi:ferredoxin
LCGTCIEQCPKNAIDMSVFGNTKPPSVILDKFIKVGENTTGDKVKKAVLNFIDDMLHPVTLLYFFGLTVFFNFFSGFYFGMIKNLEFIIRGIING